MGDYRMEQYNSEFAKLADVCRENGKIDSELYTKYNVKRGLRGTVGLPEPSGREQDAAEEFCQGCHHESIQRGYDDHTVQEHPDVSLL